MIGFNPEFIVEYMNGLTVLLLKDTGSHQSTTIPYHPVPRFWKSAIDPLPRAAIDQMELDEI